MTPYVSGNTIKSLREKKQITQKQLAEKLNISEKTVSKWETGRGLPDVCILEALSKSLDVSVSEFISGNPVTNANKAGNQLKGKFYVCPVCGNIIYSLGEGSFSCCGISLPPSEAENCDESHIIKAEKMENEYYISLDHPMTKTHYISFISYVNSDTATITKLYPQQNAEGRFFVRGHGFIYARSRNMTKYWWFC